MADHMKEYGYTAFNDWPFATNLHVESTSISTRQTYCIRANARLGVGDP